MPNTKEYRKAYYESHKEQERKQASLYYQAHKEEIALRIKSLSKENKDFFRERGLRRSHSIGVSEYNSMLFQQDGKCAICGTTDPRGRKNVFHVDHDHKSGKIRGLLCHNCNLAIGLLEDDVNRIRKAANYVERHVED